MYSFMNPLYITKEATVLLKQSPLVFITFQFLGKIPDVNLCNVFLNGHWHKDSMMNINIVKTTNCRKRFVNCPAIQLPPK